MISQSYRDTKRYLQAIDKLKRSTKSFFEIKNSNVKVIPFSNKSYFLDSLPVEEQIIKLKHNENLFCCVSHTDGVIYIQSLKKLRGLCKDIKARDSVYLIPILEWKDIKKTKLFAIPYKNNFVHLHSHSDACLHPSTLVWGEEENEVAQISYLYKMYSENRDSLIYKVRVFDGEKFVISSIKKIVKNSEKQLFKITTEGNKEIEASIDHKFLTKDGWKRLIQLSKKDFLATTSSSNDLIYDRIINIGKTEIIETYDLEVEHSSHNFVANGIITHNSVLDGLAKAEDMARRCKQLDMKAIAITDHGTMAGVIDFYKACKKYGIRPVIGQEFYFDNNRHQKGAPEEVRKSFKGKEKRSQIKLWEKENEINLHKHFILWAKNEKGLKNLYKLSSKGFTEGFYYRPRIDWELIEKHKEGLIASTACAVGLLNPEDPRDIRVRNFKKLLKIYGKENLCLEVQLNDYEKQPEMNDFVFFLHEKTGVPVYCSTDSHLIDPDPHGVHQLYMKIGAGGFSYGTGENYIKTYSDLKRTFKKYYGKVKYGWEWYEKAINETSKIAERCDVEIELGKFKLPSFQLDKAIIPALENENQNQYIIRRIKEGFKKLIVGVVPSEKMDEYKERLKHELSIIKGAGYINYMLIVLDVLDYARSKDRMFLVRGSAAGSLVCYCLGMTTVDPIKYNLLFERFINTTRMESSVLVPEFD